MAGRETSGVASTHTDNRLPHRRRGRKVVRAIEENGGWVVGYENCTGAKATEQCVEETGDVYDALTDKYLAIGCSCISPNDQRLQMLSQMVEEYQLTASSMSFYRLATLTPLNHSPSNDTSANSTTFPISLLKPTIPARISANLALVSPRSLKCCEEQG